MTSTPDTVDLASLKPGDPHYKAYVGPPLADDLMGALQFNYCIAMGLRDNTGSWISVAGHYVSANS